MRVYLRCYLGYSSCVLSGYNPLQFFSVSVARLQLSATLAAWQMMSFAVLLGRECQYIPQIILPHTTQKRHTGVASEFYVAELSAVLNGAVLEWKYNKELGIPQSVKSRLGQWFQND